MNNKSIVNLHVMGGVNAIIIEVIDRDVIDNYHNRGVYKLVGSKEIEGTIYNIYVWSQEFHPFMKLSFEWIIDRWVIKDYTTVDLGA